MAEFNNLVNETWVTCTHPKIQAKMRLFAIPYAGAGTNIFRTWAALLPDDIELCAIRIPGRETRLRERPYVQIGPLVRALAQAMEPFLDRPFALYGHSMGALIAFELARQLRRQHFPIPAHLLVSARHAPQLPDRDSPLHILPDDLFVQRMQQRYEGIPTAILQNPELMELFLPVLKADFSIIENYQYVTEDPLACPITIFGGLQDKVRNDELDGWREQTADEFECKQFMGSHFFIQSQRDPFLAEMSRILSFYL